MTQIYAQSFFDFSHSLNPADLLGQGVPHVTWHIDNYVLASENVLRCLHIHRLSLSLSFIIVKQETN